MTPLQNFCLELVSTLLSTHIDTMHHDGYFISFWYSGEDYYAGAAPSVQVKYGHLPAEDRWFVIYKLIPELKKLLAVEY